MGNNITVGYGKSINPDVDIAIKEALDEARKSFKNAAPQYAFLFTTVNYDSNLLTEKLYNELGPKIKLHGLSSCAAVMTNDGFHKGEKGSLALLLIYSPYISFGVAYSPYESDKDAYQAGVNVIKQAIYNAGKNDNDIPQLILMNASPANEEEIIEGIESIVGNKIPIVGGSCADNTIEGGWKLFTSGKNYNNGIVVTVIFSSLKIGYAFRSGCVPTDKNGIVTRASGRRIFEIGKRPAGQVYNEWTDGIISQMLVKGGNILNGTTLSPLGRAAEKIADMDFYVLSHPVYVGENGSYLDLFTEVKEGERIYLMFGTKQALIQRAGAVTRSTIIRGEFKNIEASIVIYCAGCMLTVGDQMTQVVKSINNAIGNGVYIGGFTFGEQGCFPDLRNRHGNLMISIVSFSDEKISE